MTTMQIGIMKESSNMETSQHALREEQWQKKHQTNL